jgi:hypothetical protein
MQNSRYIALFLGMAMLLTGCQSQTSSEEQITETVNVFQALPLPDLYIEIPEDYQKTSSQFYQEYYVKDSASIIVTEDASQKDYPSNRDFAINALSQYKQTTKSLNYIGEDWIQSGNYKVYVLEFSYIVADDVPEMTSYIGYVTDGDSMYIITCSAHSEDYPNHKDEFKQVLGSVRITRN